MTNLTALGIVLGVVGQAVSCLGLILQKRAHARLDRLQKEKGGEKKKKWVADPRWIIAFLIFFAGNMLAVVALSLAPQSIISALVVLVLVFNTIFAPIFLKGETIQRIDIVGVIIIVAGTVFVIAFGTKAERDYSARELGNFFIDTGFLIYGSIVIALIIGLMIYVHSAEKLAKAGGSYLKADTPKGKFTAALYALLPAILSSFNALFSKICGELVITTARGENQFTEWSTYVFIAVFIVVDVAQVIYLQRALRSFNALLIIPLYQVCLTVFGVLVGGIYFHEFASFRDYPAYRPALFTVGLLMAIAGVAVLSKRKQTTAPDEGKEMSEVEKQKKSLAAPGDGSEELEGKEDADVPITLGTLAILGALAGAKWYVKTGWKLDPSLNPPKPVPQPERTPEPKPEPPAGSLGEPAISQDVATESQTGTGSSSAVLNNGVPTVNNV